MGADLVRLGPIGADSRRAHRHLTALGRWLRLVAETLERPVDVLEADL